MKSFIFLLITLFSLTTYGQTVVSYREAPLNGSSAYFLNGTAFIEELSDGTFRFRLSSDYSTNSGPDVQIFMTNDNNFVTPINVVGALFVEDVGTVDGISLFSGTYSKILPGISALTDFDHVVFTCFGFGQLHWGNGTFGSPITPCTSTSSSIVEMSCGSYTAPSGQVFNTSGTVTAIIPNAAGCDSVITINLTINTVDVTTSILDSVVTASANGASYQWINCTSNTVLVGDTNQSYTITDNDNYAVIVTQGNCSDTSTCVNFTTVGIEESVFGSTFKLYPNPASENVTIDFGEEDAVNVLVTDVTGKVVFSIDGILDTQVNLNTISLNKGLYFVIIQNGNNQKVLKFLKD